MADTPTPRSYPQILGDMLDAFLSDQGLRNLRVGSPILSILEAAAQSDLRSSQDVFDLLNSISLDKATGLALDRIGQEEGVLKETEAPATGTVDITDTSFTRRASRLFQGLPAPIVGSFTIRVADAALWPTSGELYIGRGTSNYEGPLSYSAVSDQATHWEITLDQPTTKVHNVGESVVLAQGGNRVIGVGTIVKTPQANIADAIEFRTVYTATIPDGETSVTGVVVVAEKRGLIGNVAARAISEFSTDPFEGAEVTNSLPYSNGRETESDDQYRERIKKARRTRTKGTALAIKTAVTGITAVDENKRVTSASLVVRSGCPTTLYIDDGAGYEERTAGVAVEILVDFALGGEQYFQSKRRPIAKAFLLARNASPYLLRTGAELQVRVGGTTYTHRFDEKDFGSIASASAYEVVASINANEALGFLARTSDSGSRVVLFAKSEANETLAVVGGDVTEVFLFPSATAYSLQLYKNDRLLTKDGRPAVFASNLFGDWDAMSGDQTLDLAIDNTPTLTFTIEDQDFIDAGTGFTTVGRNTLEAWVAVLNAKIPGVTARVDNGSILLTSNAGATSNAAVEVVGGSLVSHRVFGAGNVEGQGRDYTVDRNTGQIRLEQVLAAGDRLSIGSPNTRSFIESTAIPPTTTEEKAHAWFSVDGDATRVALGLSSANPITIEVEGLHDWGQLIKLSATVPAFLHVREGDWMVCYDSNLDGSLFGNFRVAAVERDEDGEVVGTWVTIERRSSRMARAGHRVVALDPVGGNISKVLATGGYTRPHEVDLGTYVEGVTETCEVYDPNFKSVQTVPSMTRARAYHTATVLGDGRVLVTGGVSGDGEYLSSTEIYDPIRNSWTGGPNLPEAVAYQAAVLISDGTVLITGGYRKNEDNTETFSSMVCTFDPGTNTITDLTGTAPLVVARAQHRMVRLDDDRVLIAGGKDGTGTLARAETFNPSGPTCTSVTSMNAVRRDFGMALSEGATPIVVGNHRLEGNTNTYETYDPGTDSWTIAQIDAFKLVHFESKDLVENTDGVIYAMDCWYLDEGDITTAEFYYDSGAGWLEAASSNPLSIDTHTFFEKVWVEIHNDDLTTKNLLVSFGGLNASTLKPVAQLERFNSDDNTWPATDVDAAVASEVTLNTPPGLAFVRTTEPLHPIVLSEGDNYTASSLVSYLNDFLVGATATVYKTNKIRVATNSFGLEGDVALVAADLLAEDTFKLPVGDAIDNLVGHMASVESGNMEAGTPTFEDLIVMGDGYESDPDFAGSIAINTNNITGGHQLVGVRSSWTGPAESFHLRFGSNLNARIRSGALSLGAQALDASRIEVRNLPPSNEFLPYERFYAGAPFAIGPEDDLVVQVDGDLNKRYDINLWRKLKPTTNVYGLENEFKDTDGGNVSLASTFGLDYDFNDFTVYMRARALAFGSDANRRVLFRYFRLGPDGNFARVRFSNPDAPDSDVQVLTDNQDLQTDIRIKLKGGAARSPSIRATTRLGYAITSQTESVGTLVFVVGFTVTQAQRTDASDRTRLRVQLPSGVTDCGLGGGDVIYLNSSNVNFSSDQYVVVSKDPASAPGGSQDVYVTDVTAGDVTVASSIGNVSFDTEGEAKFSGAGIVAGDFLRIEDGADMNGFLKESTFKITSVGTQNLVCTSGETALPEAWIQTGLTIDALKNSDNLTVFASVSQTVTQIAAAVNALAAAVNATCPITMTVTGSGSGVVDRSTPEDTLSQDWYVLTDGVNWVSKTVSPQSVVNDYSLSFKMPVTGRVSVNADWVNEEVRIVPTTTANLVKWLNTPTASGLYASCTIQASSDGARVQIASRTPGSTGSVHVQGGLANRVAVDIKGSGTDVFGRGISTIKRSLAAGLTSGMWVSIDNSLAVPKLGRIDESTELQSWTADGIVALNQPVFQTWMAPANVKISFEKQGRFVAMSLPGLDRVRYKVKSITRDSATGLHTVAVLIPPGSTATPWQVGDYLHHDTTDVHEIVRAERLVSGAKFIFNLALKDREEGTGLQVGDSLFVNSTNSDFPSGSYTISSVSGFADYEQVECTGGVVASDITADYGIGRAEYSDSDFFDSSFHVESVGDYDSLTKTVTLTFTETAPTDVTRDWLGYIEQNIDWDNIEEGDMIRILAPGVAAEGWADVPVQNQGIFRVVRVQGESDVPGRSGTIWLENPDAVEGTFAARVAAYEYHSILPGDLLVVNTDLWGSENKGTWVVEKTGIPRASSDDQFTDLYKFKVSLATRSPRSTGNPGPLGSQSALVQIIEGRPARLVKKIEGIAPNQDDGSYVDVRWDTSWHMQQISAVAGSIVTALDKLEFPVDLAAGTDGYNHNTGLIGEANKIVYGDPSDAATYPGVAAAGAQVNINGPLVRRIKLALQLRVRTGSSTKDIADRVRSAVATAVNQVGVGTPVAISAIIAAASRVVGVISVTMISPAFNAENDLIPVQPFEKPLIVNLSQDIHVSFAGE